MLVVWECLGILSFPPSNQKPLSIELVPKQDPNSWLQWPLPHLETWLGGSNSLRRRWREKGGLNHFSYFGLVRGFTIGLPIFTWKCIWFCMEHGAVQFNLILAHISFGAERVCWGWRTPGRRTFNLGGKLDDGWPESEKDVFQAALSMVVVKNSRW